MLQKFRLDSNYLTKYHVGVSIALLIINAGLALTTPLSLHTTLVYLPCLVLISSPQIVTVLSGVVYALILGTLSEEFQLIHLLGIPIGILMTFPVTALIHCASHGSIRPKWMNRPIGEVMGLIQLYGFPDWKILHFVHHSHADDPELDPHPPLNRKYWDFTKEMRRSAATAFAKYFFKQFGHSKQTIQSATWFARAAKLDTVMKLVFWYLILGSQAFTFLYLTSVGFKMLHYAWLNHATHRPVQDASEGRTVEIQNLNYSIYRMINLISFGLYYHKNHHLAPSLFNPKYLDKHRRRRHPDGPSPTRRESEKDAA